MCMYLKELEKERQRSPIYSFTSQQATMAMAEPSLSQESGASSTFLVWVAGDQTIGPSPTPFPR